MKKLILSILFSFIPLSANAVIFKYVQLSTEPITYLQPSTTNYWMKIASGTIVNFNSSTMSAVNIMSSSSTTSDFSSIRSTSTNFNSSNSVILKESVSSMTVVNLATFNSTSTFNSITIFIGSTSIKGTSTNNNANTGFIGEYISSASTGGTTFAATTQLKDLVSIPLTAGDWDVSGVVYATLSGATFTEFRIGISQASGNDATGLTLGDNYLSALAPTSSADTGQTMPCVRISLSGSSTAYLKFQGFFSAGGPPQARGRISARRVR